MGLTKQPKPETYRSTTELPGNPHSRILRKLRDMKQLKDPISQTLREVWRTFNKKEPSTSKELSLSFGHQSRSGALEDVPSSKPTLNHLGPRLRVFE
ncbi:hypothetical protein RRG08_046339 [Elysia crispata]|uniref:Uncharacterized protein n=1 Tax=Elysia crispata TaxID=231223 RepID=A0AAE1DSV0_9GAST|nr:hypothetical protein RRG08_046339 [Elysia crispata]